MLVFSFIWGPAMIIPIGALASTTTNFNSVELGGKTVAPAKYTEPDSITGSLSYDIPIVVPPGRNGMTPDLVLRYSSLPSEDVGVFGYGWNISIPYIERLNVNGTHQIFNQYNFYSSSDGELVGTTSGTTTAFAARSEMGDFQKYLLKNGTYWEVTDKMGTVFKYGYSSSSRQDNASNTSQIARWMLEEIRDTNNNYITYEYFKDSNQIYPSKITYTGNAATSGPFEIEFVRESRADASVSYRTGFKVQSNYRISEITTEVNNAWVRKYDLDYQTGDNGARSLLGTSTESGRDSLGTVYTLPPTIFTYQRSLHNWEENTTYDLPIWIRDSGVSNFDNGVRFADVNGDALTDVLRGYNSISQIYLSTGMGWYGSATWTLPVPFVSGDTDNYVRIADVNGDFKADFIQSYEDGGIINRTYLKTDSGWSEDPTWDLPVYFKETGKEDAGVRLADVNGDGLVDVLRSYHTGTTSINKVYHNNGTGWTLSTTTIPVDFLREGEDKYVMIEDVNGDSLPDLVQAYPKDNLLRTFLNTGTGWVEDLVWDSPINFTYNDSVDDGVRFADLNGDGLVDIIQASIRSVGSGGATVHSSYLNDGSGWNRAYEWDLHPDINFVSTYLTDSYNDRLQMFDADGDGALDIARAANGGGYDPSLQIVTYINKGGGADLLVGVTTAQGGTTEIEYETSTTPNPTTGALPNPHLPIMLNIVKEVTIGDGMDGAVSHSYTYGGGRYYIASSTDKKFAGFATTTKTDGAGNTTKTWYHQGNTTNSAQGEYDDHFSKIGLAYATEVRDESGNLFTRLIEKWDRDALSNGRSFVKKANILSQSYDGDADHTDLAEEYTYSAGNGNLLTKVEWGEVTGIADGTWSDTGSDKRTTTVTYASSSGGYLVGLPSNETVTNQSSTKIKENRFYYDSSVSGTAIKGNLTKQEMWATSTTYSDIEKDYNSYGLVTVERDPKDYSTYFSYDSYNLYPASTTNPLSQQTFITYDYSAGKPTQVTDVNGRVFNTTFDGLDRITEEKQPDISSPGSSVVKASYAYTDTGMPRKIQKTENLSGSNAVDTYSYFDGLGRVIQTRREAEGSNTYSVQDIEYDERGLLAGQSQPYFETGSAYDSPTTVSTLWTTYTYDTVGRQTAINTSVGNTTKTYDDWKTTTTDALGVAKDHYRDAYGNLSKVTEYNSGVPYHTNYTYDALGNLTRITDASGNVRNFSFDGLGRRLAAEDLHSPTDNTYGLWTYVYDLSGNLGTSTDPKGQVVTFTYDALNRVLTENYADLAGTEIVYAYDRCPEGKGRLCAATTTDTATSYEYNALGQVKKESKKIATTTYATQFAYDRLGNQTSITYPDNAEATYAYNNAGLLESVERKENGGSYTAVVSDFDYGPQGKPTYVEYANAVQTSYTYDPTKLYRLTNKTTVAGGGMGGSLEDGLEGLSEVGDLLSTFDLSESLPDPEGFISPAAEVRTASAEAEESATVETLPDVEAAVATESPEPITIQPQESVPEDTEPTSTTTLGDSSELRVPTTTDSHAVVPDVETDALGSTSTKVATSAEPLLPSDGATTTQPVIVPTAKEQSIHDQVELAAYSPMTEGIEAVELRTEHSKTYRVGTTDQGEALYATRIYEAPIHTQTSVGSYVDTTVTVREGNESWMAFSPAQRVTVQKNLTDGLFSYIGSGAQITVVADGVSAKTAPSFTHIPARGEVAVFDGVYGTGTALQVGVTEDYVRKDIVLDSFAAAKPFITAPNRAEFSFDLGAEEGIDLVVDTVTLSEVGSIETRSTAQLVDEKGNVLGFIWSPAAVDERDSIFPEDRGLVTVRYEKTEKGIRATKLIDAQWLENAAYPVRADLTFSGSTGFGDGDVTGNSVTATSGSYAAFTWTTNSVIYSGNENGPAAIARGFLSFDTSALPDTAVVASGTVNVYLTSTYNGTGDAYADVRVFQGNQNSAFALVPDDYDQCGNTVVNPDAGTDALTMGLGTSTYHAWTLNATGTSWISKTGYTKLCMREGHDYQQQNIAGTGVTVSGFKFAAHEMPGTTTDPYLELVYTIPNATPTAPTALQAEGEVNPTSVTDTTPEFTAQYNDPDTTDSATKYRVQVAAESTFTTTLLWDSGIAPVTGGTTTNPVYQDWLSDTFSSAGWGSTVSFNQSATSSQGTTSIKNIYNSAWGSLALYSAPGINTTGYGYLSFSVNRGTSTAPDLYVRLYQGAGWTEVGTVALSSYLSSLSTSTWHHVMIPLSALGATATTVNVVSFENGTASTLSFDNIRFEGTVASVGSNVSEGDRTPQISYAGTPLSLNGSTYFHRMKLWDDENAESPWSSTAASSSFTMAAHTGASVLQDLTYTYDSVGNLTRIDEEASTDAARIARYQYDDLYRLTTASSTSNSGTPLYTETYTYSPLGNILSKTDQGTYSYTGSSSLYANPHAVTAIATTGATTTYTYDQNGNLTTTADTSGSGSAYSIYTDSFTSGWSNAGWSSITDLSHTATTSAGTNAIRNQYTSAWGSFAPYSYGGITTTGYTHLSFAVNRGTSTTPNLYIKLYRTDAWIQLGSVQLSSYLSSLATSTWYTVSIPLSALGATATSVNAISFENGAISTLSFDTLKLTTSGATTTYSYTYDNRLASTTIGSTVSLYQYDHTGQRTLYGSPTGTTTYPSSLYSITSGTTTKHIMAHGELLATIENRGATTLVHYVHTDHLGGTNVVSTASGTLEQTLDYYPFGAIRIDTTTTQFDQKKKYTGHEFDQGTGLYYMKARYQEPGMGRFVSQDPAYLAAGDVWSIQEITSKNLAGYLSDPQGLNSYSYTRNNPIRYVDQNGEWLSEWWNGEQSNEDFVIEIGDAAEDLYEQNKYWRFLLDNPEGPAVVGTLPISVYTGGGGGALLRTGTAAATANRAKTAYDVAKAGGKHSGHYKNYLNRTTNELVDSINSYKQLIKEHQAKIANPAKEIPGWSKLDPRHQKDLLTNKWPNDIERAKEFINIMQGIIKERF
jgi:RHS repeat-associated protein